MIKADTPEILMRMSKHNTHDDPIKIRARTKKSGGYIVYLDFFRNGKRELKYLPKNYHFDGTKSKLIEDKEKLAVIIKIRDQHQHNLLNAETGFSLASGKGKDFFSYFSESFNKNKTYEKSFKHLIKFTKKETFLFSDVNRLFCQQFADYLQATLSKSSSAATYYTAFKAVLNRAVIYDIIAKNPATGITIKKNEARRFFLTIDELTILKATPYPNNQTCNAFIFSCFTGLRISDIRALTFDQIQDDFIEFKQIKTKTNERLPLNENALEIIANQRTIKQSNYIFNLNTIRNIETHLKIWTIAANINKHITYHCSRHTFATLCLTFGVDLYTISKLMGHADFSTTQIYAKLIDEKRTIAVNKLPKI